MKAILASLAVILSASSALADCDYICKMDERLPKIHQNTAYAVSAALNCGFTYQQSEYLLDWAAWWTKKQYPDHPYGENEEAAVSTVLFFGENIWPDVRPTLRVTLCREVSDFYIKTSANLRMQ